MNRLMTSVWERIRTIEFKEPDKILWPDTQKLN